MVNIIAVYFTDMSCKTAVGIKSIITFRTLTTPFDSPNPLLGSRGKSFNHIFPECI